MALDAVPRFWVDVDAGLASNLPLTGVAVWRLRDRRCRQASQTRLGATLADRIILPGLSGRLRCSVWLMLYSVLASHNSDITRRFNLISLAGYWGPQIGY